MKSIPYRRLAAAGLSVLAVLPLAALPGCSSSEASSSPTGGITPRQFADGVHAVMMADRTVYATHVVTNLKKQDAPVKAFEYWEDTGTEYLKFELDGEGAEAAEAQPVAGD